MSPFAVEHSTTYGRRATIETARGTIETPALYPVMNFIAGTTTDSGGIWKYTRNQIMEHGCAPAVMMQAMGFLDYDLSADALEWWRDGPSLHEKFDRLNRPLFIDSGGFKLMNSATFGDPPDKGGSKNPWEIYTNPESILDLQTDYGADIIATLDYPIPPGLKEDEKMERMERSIDSAVRCLELLEDYDNPPAVYIAIHGHNYEDINWYVGRFLERAGEFDEAFEGFAIGSLVPIASSRKVDILVDIIQGAKHAIPNGRADEIALHTFGVTGKLVPLLALLGVDSFDSASYQRTAQYKKFIHPETWEKIEARNLPAGWSCDCIVCRHLDTDLMQKVLYSDTSYEKIEGYYKSEFYADIAHHNYEVYQKEIGRIHKAISDDRLLQHVLNVARDHQLVKAGLKHAQLRNPDLKSDIEAMGAEELVAGPETRTFQSKLTGFTGNIDPAEQSVRTISLEHGPSDFDVLQRNYTPPENAEVLLIIPCSQHKPYRESRTHQAILDEIQHLRDRIHKVTVSGLYGPVPEEFEDEKMILEYEYVLTTEDTDQLELVSERLRRYLNEFGDGFDTIVGYTTSKAYRRVIENALSEYGKGEIFPKSPQSLQLTEHFRQDNIEGLVDFLEANINGRQ